MFKFHVKYEIGWWETKVADILLLPTSKSAQQPPSLWPTSTCHFMRHGRRWQGNTSPRFLGSQAIDGYFLYTFIIMNMDHLISTVQVYIHYVAVFIEFNNELLVSYIWVGLYSIYVRAFDNLSYNLFKFYFLKHKPLS